MKSISTILLSIALLISLSGVELRYHHCSTSGTTDYIVTLPVLDQTYTAADFNCQCAPVASEVPHCEKCTIDSETPTKDDCCDSGTEFIQLEMEYLAKAVHKIESPKIINLFAVVTPLFFEKYTDQTPDSENEYTDPPPKQDQYGKYIIISNRQLKIPSA
ncbi:MAG: hypothetical protein C0599_17770 [Salinivirgaceae bacterium]|nr:MAG: hypothetical protein C0599_17770 [Salinivirgaceae bacterium]